MRLTGMGDPVNRISFSPDGRFLVGGCGISPPHPRPEASLLLWDVKGTTVGDPERPGSPVERGPTVHGVAFHPDGRHFATASEGGLVQLWDRVTRTPITVCRHVPTATEVAFSRDGRHLASTGSDHAAVISDVATLATRLVLPHPYSTSGIAFSPDGAYVVTGCNDGVVRVWDAADPGSSALVAELRGHAPTAIPQVAFWPGHPGMFATCSWDQTVRLWSLSFGHSAAVLGSGFFPKAVTGISFSPSGDALVTACADNAYLWDMSKAPAPRMRPSRTLTSPGTFAATYTDAGSVLATTSADVVRLWRMG
jgi:WD40 repeat protein